MIVVPSEAVLRTSNSLRNYSDMDRIHKLERDVLGRQKYMNAVIEEGNSPIQQFFSGATIFITGGGGFLGKQFIEKLLRACKIKKIYVLLRPKKGKSIQERLQFMLTDPVYDMVRRTQSDFADILQAIEGDISELNLGLSDKDYVKITDEVDFVVHMAATIRFDGPLRDATLANVRGVRECVFTYVSTAFTHATRDRIGTELKEQFYPCPVPPDQIIELAENESKTVEDIREE
ncbi:unnamed protein product [Arctia plantaginis]|uniref:Fatty acyl-CoA reductase n=1 Tax=Arctia plantaginis TaxID=874455 RepID=A0A8S1B0A8_ARCPL|nr:unnamed protein product [Arctia plantaginis]